jgi:hypothetical protein
MILKGSQRSGGKQLGLHLLKTEENEHVEIHEVRGFVSDSVLGAMKEAHVISCGTKCKQYLFSLSLNPPETENVAIETFEHAIDAIEERLGLSGQPRVVVFHEKQGRRHAHVVWSRINAETMTARPLSFFKTKLQEVSRQLYLENGWKMPLGLVERGRGDPRNFTLAEWQQAKRAGYDARETKELIQQCWAASDDRKSFERSLEERGMFLAKGDRRSHVVVTYDGNVISLSRASSLKTRELAARLGEADTLRSIDATKTHIADTLGPRLKQLISIARKNARAALETLQVEKTRMTAEHRLERARLDRGQAERRKKEATERAARLRSGLGGIWDRLTGERGRLIKQNEIEAIFSVRRDQAQRHIIIRAQLRERRLLEERIKCSRQSAAAVVHALHLDASRYKEPALQSARQSTRNGLSASRNGASERVLSLN